MARVVGARDPQRRFGEVGDHQLRPLLRQHRPERLGQLGGADRRVRPCCSPKHPKVLRWLARHPRFVFPDTPTSGAWRNAVETCFSALTRRRLERAVFHSVVDLQAAIHRYIAAHNQDPRPFLWTTTAEQILAQLTPLNAPVH